MHSTMRGLVVSGVAVFALLSGPHVFAQAVATTPGRPYKTFDDVIRVAKAKSGSITYGSVGAGSLGHLTLRLVQQAGGFKLVHVPYKGGGPMTTDLVGGHIELGIGSVALLAPQLTAGKLRAVAKADKRSAAMPDVPALAEQGLPGL
jgi:tripartite-type tricarboxylate transporter receptor subunit TctC